MYKINLSIIIISSYVLSHHSTPQPTHKHPTSLPSLHPPKKWNEEEAIETDDQLKHHPIADQISDDG